MQTTHLSLRDNNRSTVLSVQELIGLADSDLGAWASTTKRGGTLFSSSNDGLNTTPGNRSLDERLCRHLDHVLEGKQDVGIYPTPPAFFSLQGDSDAKSNVVSLSKNDQALPSQDTPVSGDDGLFSPEHEISLGEESVLLPLHLTREGDTNVHDPPMVTEDDFDFFDSPIHKSPSPTPEEKSPPTKNACAPDIVMGEIDIVDGPLEPTGNHKQSFVSQLRDPDAAGNPFPIATERPSIQAKPSVRLKTDDPDSRYVESGKYGFQPPKQEPQQPPGLMASLSNAELPRIGFHPVSDDEVSMISSDDEGSDIVLPKTQNALEKTQDNTGDIALFALGAGDETNFKQDEASKELHIKEVETVKLRLSSKTRLWPLMLRLLLSQLEYHFQGSLGSDETSSPLTTLSTDSIYEPRLLLPPAIRLRRADEAADVSLSAFDFWAELKLQPQHGTKNLCICLVHALDSTTQRGVDLFKEILAYTYEAHSLGQLQFESVLYDNIWQESTMCHNFLVNLFQSRIASDDGDKYRTPDARLFLLLPDLSQKNLVQVCLALSKCSQILQQIFSQLVLVPEDIITSLPSEQRLSMKMVVHLAHQIYGRNGDSVSDQTFQLSRRRPKQFILRQPQPASERWKAEQFLHVAYKFQWQKGYLIFCIVDDRCHRKFQTVIPMERGGSSGRAQFEAGRQMWMLVLEVLKSMSTKPGLIFSSMNVNDQHLKMWIAFEERSKPTELVVLDVAKDMRLDQEEQQTYSEEAYLERTEFDEDEDKTAALIKQSRLTLGLSTSTSTQNNPELLLMRRVEGARKNTAFKIKHGHGTFDSESLLQSMHGLTSMSQVKGFDEQLPIHLALVERGCAAINSYT